MSEFRQDPLTGTWVIVAPERGARPRAVPTPQAPRAARPDHDPACPFCPGNERMLAEILEETPAPGPHGWRARVLRNKYPALTPGTGAPATGFPTPSLPGHGYHEVIVDTPRHGAEPVTLARDELADVLRAYRRRYAEHIARPGIRAVVIFRNRGEQGGATLDHPHSQVIATALVPPRLAATSAWAQAHHGREGQCVTCAVLAAELADGRRVVETSDHFAALVPFAATCPFEQRILPRRHQTSFAEAAGHELDDLAGILKRALARMSRVLGDPPYNYVIESGTAVEAGAPHAHWTLRIVPGTTRPGGFELGGGLPINPSRPESDARSLRSASGPVPDRGP